MADNDERVTNLWKFTSTNRILSSLIHGESRFRTGDPHDSKYAAHRLYRRGKALHPDARNGREADRKPIRSGHSRSRRARPRARRMEKPGNGLEFGLADANAGRACRA